MVTIFIICISEKYFPHCVAQCDARDYFLYGKIGIEIGNAYAYHLFCIKIINLDLFAIAIKDSFQHNVGKGMENEHARQPRSRKLSKYVDWWRTGSS